MAQSYNFLFNLGIRKKDFLQADEIMVNKIYFLSFWH